MGNKNRKAKEPIEKTFSKDKLGSIVRKERHKAEAAAEWDEIESIRKSQANHDYTTASAPENQAHNRYPNVMALEATRVKLTDQYINANWIDGFHKDARHAYIATQAPLEESFDRFWEMIWKSDACVIVMLTNFIESQKRKADQYWPKNIKEVARYGNYEVEFLEETPLIKTTEPEAPPNSSPGQGLGIGPRTSKTPHKTGPYTAYIVRTFCLRYYAPLKKESSSKHRSETTVKQKDRELETKETKQTRESKSETDADDTLKPTKEDDTKRHKKGEDDDGKGKGKDDELETERLIYHYHYCSWPDMDVPSNGNDLIEMMQEAEKKQRERIQESKPVESLRGDYADEGSPPFPMVVHCSAGIGRAGTYILIHTALSYAQDNDYSDYSAIPVKDVVAKLRQQRGGMIQTKEQYIFSTSVIREHLSHLQSTTTQ